MKKFDKFLEFLFHTKLGVISLVVSVAASMFLFSGCIVADLCACYCDFFMCGSGIACSSIGKECDEAFGCEGCSLYTSYAELHPYGDTCTMCACGEWCSSGSSSSSSSSSSGCNSSSSSNGYIYVTISYNGVESSNKYSDSNGLSKGDKVVYDVPSSYSKYFDLEGYYSYDGKKVLDANGEIVDDSLFKKKIDFTLYARGAEKMFGEVVTIEFDTSNSIGTKLNPVKVRVGGTIDVFRTLPETYSVYKFKGWVLKGSTGDSYFEVIEGETVFHFYDFGATPGETVVLAPIYELEGYNYGN